MPQVAVARTVAGWFRAPLATVCDQVRVAQPAVAPPEQDAVIDALVERRWSPAVRLVLTVICAVHPVQRVTPCAVVLLCRAGGPALTAASPVTAVRQPVPGQET
ncbi:hypothetical protein GCM10009559_42820 [Pseudonocardia zijingensis]|uniref:Uncharacterized protein n=1 Tax=Pseudonocardia zijingensis TaxID=153376 RepID=A0ABN1QNU4_9PSEU